MPDTVNTLITGIENSKSDIATSIEGKGVIVPSGTKLAGMSSLIDQISTMHGPASSIDGNFAAFDGTSGDTLKDSGFNSNNFINYLGEIDSTSTITVSEIPQYLSSVNYIRSVGSSPIPIYLYRTTGTRTNPVRLMISHIGSYGYGDGNGSDTVYNMITSILSGAHYYYYSTPNSEEIITATKTFTSSPIISSIIAESNSRQYTVAGFSYEEGNGSKITSFGHFIAYGDDDTSNASKPTDQTGFTDLDTYYFNTGITLINADNDDTYKLSFPAQNGTLATTDDIINVVANPSTTTATLTGITIGDTSYAIDTSSIEIVDLRS